MTGYDILKSYSLNTKHRVKFSNFTTYTASLCEVNNSYHLETILIVRLITFKTILMVNIYRLGTILIVRSFGDDPYCEVNDSYHLETILIVRLCVL